jgi:predicted alpha/beta-hydrolase family hydrolase
MTVDIETPHGLARATLHEAGSPRGALILGHGAGGGFSAPDLMAASAVAGSLDLTVALVEQPYRVAGRKSPAPAHQLDTAWKAVVAELAAGPLAGLQLVTGGRSSGARVACRTAGDTDSAGVLCLAFPLHAPSKKPVPESKTRLPELEAVDVPVLIVQGESDPFGMPPAAPGRRVVRVKGNHSLRGDKPALEAAVRDWLAELLASA